VLHDLAVVVEPEHVDARPVAVAGPVLSNAGVGVEERAWLTFD
jgi:hypothetical protein